MEVFSIVNQFIYTRELSDDTDHDLDWGLLFRTWLFGDKYLMPALQNRVMDTLIEKVTVTNSVPTPELKFIYKNTLPGSPLRNFLVDLAAYTFDLVSVMTSDESKRWPHEALLDLVKIVAARDKEDIGMRDLPEVNMGRCYYHIHVEGEDCDPEL